MKRLQAWLSTPEADLLREQLVAIAVVKTVEAAQALCASVGEPGVQDNTAKLAAEGANDATKFLILLKQMETGPYEFLRVKPVINENL